MESTDYQTPNTPSIDAELFTERAISGATFLGGPMAGTYLIAHNFKSLGQEDRARNTWIAGVTTTLLIVPILLAIPEEMMKPSLGNLITLILALPAYLVVHYLQQEAVESHIASGGKKGSGWKAFGVGIAGAIALLSYAILCASMMNPSLSDPIPDFVPATVGMEGTSAVVQYDSTNISKSDALVVMATLLKVGYFRHNTDEAEAIFYKKDSQYTIVLWVVPEALTISEVHEVLKTALVDLNKSYGNRNYRFRLIAADETSLIGEKVLDPRE